MLEPGDIFAVKGKGILGWLASKLMAPATDRFHFGLIWQKVDGDYIILESIAKGIAVGRLSMYEGKDVEFYRVACPEDLRAQAPIELTKWGRAKYDYLLVVKLVIQGLWLVLKHLIIEGKFRRIRAEELSWTQNDSLVCTEGADIGFDAVGVNVIPIEVCPTPSEFKQAELDERIHKIAYVKVKR